jgi:hypothetical protein
MKNRSITIRFFGLFMLVSVLLNSFTPAHAVVVEQAVSHQKTSDDDATDSEGQVSLSEWSSEVVVPSHAFSFDNNLFVVLTPKFNFIFSETVAYKTTKPLYRHSYFEKLYERHIAINAP